MSEPGVDRHLIYRFGHCRFDNRTLELTVHDQTVALEPKPLALLLSLLQQAGEVVTKDELHDSVWPGRLLSESVLTKTMAKLRQALQDDEQQIIKTVHGFGYRLVAPVSLVYREPDRPPPQLNFGAGDTPPLRPNWRLRVALGRGGFGEVWLAEHDKTGDQRVFKFGLDARGLTALKREITLSRLLKHIHGDRQDLVHILDWNLEQPPYFLETEFADGGALSQWAQRQGGLHSIALAQRLELVAQAADALAAAHIAGVLHKDLKPSNLLVQDTAVGAPQLKLADFGSGRLFDPEPIAGLDITRLGFTQTQHGQDSTTGTPAYFAPELLAGQQLGREVGGRAGGAVLAVLGLGETEPGDVQAGDGFWIEQPAATKVGELELRRPDRGVLHQQIARLQVLVQHPGDMGGGQGIGCLCNKFQALRQGYAVQPALALRPLRQGAAIGEFGFQEVGWLFKIPVEDMHQILPVAVDVLQQAGQRDFALQRREPARIQAELEDALVAGLVMFGQPNLAEPAAAQCYAQAPVRAQRWGVAGAEIQLRWRTVRLAVDQADRCHQSIAETMNGLDDLLFVVLQGLTQLGHGLGQHGFGEQPAGPHAVMQLVLGDHLAGLLQQAEQQRQRLGLQRHGLVMDRQLQRPVVEPAVPEAVDQMAIHAGLTHGRACCAGGARGSPRGFTQSIRSPGLDRCAHHGSQTRVAPEAAMVRACGAGNKISGPAAGHRHAAALHRQRSRYHAHTADGGAHDSQTEEGYRPSGNQRVAGGAGRRAGRRGAGTRALPA